MKDERPHLSPVSPKLEGRALWLPPRTLVVAVIAGLVAFAVGLALAPTRETLPAPSASSPPATLASPSATADMSVPVLLLDPSSILASLPGGAACVLTGGGGTTSLPFLHQTWLFRCALSVARRPGVVSGLATGIEAVLARGVLVSDSETQDPRSPVIMDWWRYEAPGLHGTVEFFGLDAGSAFDVIVVHAAASP